jgi:alpha-1,3-mannosyl-glycoprotein beta-1,2-N-acetylglucosaminyltransferase
MVGRRLPRGKVPTGNYNRWTIERRFVCILLIMAWSWIVGFMGVVIWHLNKPSAPVSTTTTTTSSSSSSRAAVVAAAALPKSAIISSSSSSHGKYESPLLIFTCNRANYLQETLQDIYNHIPQPCHFGCPIIVSQDGTNQEVAKVIQTFQTKFQLLDIPLVHIQHTTTTKAQAQQSALLRGSTNTHNAYQALAQHYAWALTQLFEGKIKRIAGDAPFPIPQRVVILEEDLHISPDFFDYFQATAPLLDKDPTLFAVSAYNDNGHLVKDPKRLLRSDFFPGLGWMMTRQLWVNELQSKWPSAYWDDWLREPAQRKGRQVIRPEISRTYHFGKQGGASHNQFGSILQSVKLNQEAVDFLKLDLSYLQEPAYNAMYAQLLQKSKRVSSLDDAMKMVQTENVRLEYRDYEHFKRLAKQINIMDDEKAMIPRTAYKGVVETRPHGEYLLFLTPPLQQLQQDFAGLIVA